MEDFKDRLIALCGWGAMADFAEAVEIHHVSLSKQVGKGRVDPTLIAHLEWLETTPTAAWPERWAKLRARAEKQRARP